MARRASPRPQVSPGAGELQRVFVDRIEVPPRRLRRDLGDVGSLAVSLDTYGQLAPVVCYADAAGRLQLIAGERRLEATRRLHAARVAAGHAPAGSVAQIDVLVRSLGAGQEPAELELIENEQRRELSDEEEADAFIQLVREARRNLQQLAEMSGRSVAYVSKRIRVFEDPRLRLAIGRGEVATSQAEELLALPEPVRAELLERSVAEGWTHDQMRKAVRALGSSRGLTAEAPGADARRAGGLAGDAFDFDADDADFRVENSAAHTAVRIERPADLTRRIRELDAILSDLRPFQLRRPDERALVSLWRTLGRLGQAGRQEGAGRPSAGQRADRQAL
jgi:ParB/RepB/Spo0J family partition protein